MKRSEVKKGHLSIGSMAEIGCSEIRATQPASVWTGYSSQKRCWSCCLLSHRLFSHNLPLPKFAATLQQPGPAAALTTFSNEQPKTYRHTATSVDGPQDTVNIRVPEHKFPQQDCTACL